MTNIIKKPVSIILTFLLIISVFTIVPVSASAVTDESLFGFDNGTITSYSGSDTDIEIPDTINGTPVTAIGDEAFKYSSISSIVIPDSVTSIGEEAFYGSYFTSITLGDGLESIGNEAFEYCYYLTSIDIPDSVTSIGDNAFYYCSGLTSVTLGNSVQTIGEYAFYDCYNSNFKEITIPASTTSIGQYAFQYCSNLKKVTFLNSNTTIGYRAFYYCSNKLKLVGYDPSTAKDYVEDPNNYNVGFVDIAVGIPEYEYTLDGDNATITAYNGDDTVLELPDSLDDHTVTAIGSNAFASSDITSVTIPNSITSIGYCAFYYCASLSSVTIGSGVELIDDYAFENCTALTSIDIPGNVDTIDEYAFYYCRSLSSVTIGNGVEIIGEYAFYNCSALTSVEIPDTVSEIGSSAFSYCSDLESVTIGSGLEYLNYYQFYDCSSLTEVTIYSRTVEIDDRAFEYCPSDITFYGYTGSTTDTYASSLDNSYNFVPLAENISEYEYDLNGTNATITAYNGTDTEVEIPDGIDGYTVTEIGENAFYNNSSMTSIDIPNTVTSIGSNAFGGCTNLTELNIPDSVTSYNGSICGGCSNLTTISFGNGITSISVGSFAGLSGLKNVVIGNSVTAIDFVAFGGCINLECIIIPRNVTTINSPFGGCNKVKIYGYDGSDAEEYAESNNIPFITMFNTNKGDSYEGDALTGTQSRESGDSSFNLSQNSYENIELLGVQKKTSRGANDMRFVAVINEGIIKDSSVADYGFVAAKTDHTTTAQATDSFISKVTLGAANTVKRSCVGTVNSFCGAYGTNAGSTKYKYVTLAVEDVPANQGFVVRFYIKTKSGKVFYANYNTEYTGCVTSFANLSTAIS